MTTLSFAGVPGLLVGLLVFASGACGGSTPSEAGAAVADPQVGQASASPASGDSAGAAANSAAATRNKPAGGSPASAPSAASGGNGSAGAADAANGGSGPASAAASGTGPAPAAGGASAAPAAGSGTGPASAGAAADSGTMPASGAGGAPASGGADAAGSGKASNPGSQPASCTGSQGQVPVIYIIGDSTAAVYAQDKYPAMGWAQPLQEYFKPACATVQDKAINGRSSKSFFDEGSWTPVKTALRKGDFVLIQFGHNDEKKEDATRFTEPFGSYQQQLSTYIDDTLAAGATPVLLTSIERNKWNGTMLSSTHGDYPEAVRQLAQKRQLTLVDMTELTHAYLERIGQTAAGELYMHLAPGAFPAYPDGVTDDTHLQDKGAHAFAELALADFARQRTPIGALLDRVPMP